VKIPRTGYRVIADDLAARILSGEYPPGSPIPTYKELATIYSVSVTTVQRALIILQDRGLVVGVPGRRNYVADELPKGNDT
jgi:GntR family transcriptional regulator